MTGRGGARATRCRPRFAGSRHDDEMSKVRWCSRRRTPRRIARVQPAGGGSRTEATRVVPPQVGHRFPHFLPDGKHFLFLDNGHSCRCPRDLLGRHSIRSRRAGWPKRTRPRLVRGARADLILRAVRTRSYAQRTEPVARWTPSTASHSVVVEPCSCSSADHFR